MDLKWFWIFEGVSLSLLFAFGAYSVGWRKGWRACMDKRDVYKRMMHGSLYGIPDPRKRTIDDVLQKYNHAARVAIGNARVGAPFVREVLDELEQALKMEAELK